MIFNQKIAKIGVFMELLLNNYEYQNDLFDIAREFFPTTIDDTSVIKIDYTTLYDFVEMQIDM